MLRPSMGGNSSIFLLILLYSTIYNGKYSAATAAYDRHALTTMLGYLPCATVTVRGYAL